MRGGRKPATRRRSALVGGLVGCLLGFVWLAGAPPASAEPVGWVAGTVRAQGDPVANAWVSIMPVTPAGGWAGTPVQTTTDQHGRYSFANVHTPHVKLHVRAPAFSGLANSYWPDSYAFATAGLLRVGRSGTTADVDLPAGASISGRVVDADTGAPVTAALVLAHVQAPPGWESVGRPGLADGPGQFVIDELPPVPVSLQVHPREGTNHLAQWYDRVGFHGTATAVRPGATGIVIQLREGAEVGGVVRDDDGRAVPGATVTIIGCPSLCPMTARTDPSGAYRIHGVPPGVGLRAYVEADAEGLLDRWYSAPGQTGDTSFDLTTGQVRRDLDVTLTSGAVVVGRAVDQQTGQPIAGVTVELVDVDNPLRSYLSRATRSPGAPPALEVPDGAAGPQASPEPAPFHQPPPVTSGGLEVVVGPVPPGVYTLVVHPGGRNRDYQPVELVARTGIDGTGQVVLARGERARITLSLARQRMTTQAGTAGAGGPGGSGVAPGTDVPVAGPPGSHASAGWPGLFGGFLASGGGDLLGLGS